MVAVLDTSGNVLCTKRGVDRLDDLDFFEGIRKVIFFYQRGSASNQNIAIDASNCGSFVNTVDFAGSISENITF